MATKPGLDLLRERLIQDIFAGVLPAGSWLKQAELEERYGVTRALVRRALDDLTARNYVQHEPNRGYRIAQSSDDHRKELREVRLILELHAAASVVERVTQPHIERLRELAEDFAQAIRHGAPREQIAANSAFHEQFYATEENQTLYNILVEMRRRAVALVVTPWHSVEQMERASQDHFDMVDALEARDLAELRRLIERHINAARYATRPRP
jgi:DNA-binding GntR family transcriptional regulator